MTIELNRPATGGPLGVVFDLDGVIVDSFAVMRQAFDLAYAEVVGEGHPPFEEYNKHLGRYFPDIMRIMGLPLAMEEPFVRESYRLAGEVKVHDGIRETIAELRERGHRIAVATGKSGPRARSLLETLGLIELFDVVIGSDEIARPKPAPDIVRHAMDVLDVPADRSMMIGDAVTDIQSGQAAGVTAIAVVWGCEGNTADLLAAEPDVVLERPEELLALCPSAAVAST